MQTKTLGALLLVTLTGCAGNFMYETKVNCLTFYSPYYLNVDSIDQNVNLAANLMMPVVGDFCKELGHVKVKVLKQGNWPCSNPSGSCSGSYDFFDGIHLNDDFYSFVHEFFHAWETEHFRDSQKHSNWDTIGYDAIDAKFVAARNTDIWRTSLPSPNGNGTINP